MSNLSSAPLLLPAELMSSSATQAGKLGMYAETSDGRGFRYCKAGTTALVPGKLQQGPAVEANHQNIAVAVAAAIGATSVTVTLGATLASVNQYAEGFLVVSDATGEGHTYKISGHPAAALNASLVLTLEDKIIVALTTSSEVCLILNQYSGVIVNPTTFTNMPVGVAIYPVVASEFGWVQCRGPVSCLNGDAALTVGSQVSPSNATAGAVENGVIAQGFVGTALQTGVDTEYRAINLNIS